MGQLKPVVLITILSMIIVACANGVPVNNVDAASESLTEKIGSNITECISNNDCRKNRKMGRCLANGTCTYSDGGGTVVPSVIDACAPKNHDLIFDGSKDDFFGSLYNDYLDVKVRDKENAIFEHFVKMPKSVSEPLTCGNVDEGAVIQLKIAKPRHVHISASEVNNSLAPVKFVLLRKHCEYKSSTLTSGCNSGPLYYKALDKGTYYIAVYGRAEQSIKVDIVLMDLDTSESQNKIGDRLLYVNPKVEPTGQYLLCAEEMYPAIDFKPSQDCVDQGAFSKSQHEYSMCSLADESDQCHPKQVVAQDLTGEADEFEAPDLNVDLNEGDYLADKLYHFDVPDCYFLSGDESSNDIQPVELRITLGNPNFELYYDIFLVDNPFYDEAVDTGVTPGDIQVGQYTENLIWADDHKKNCSTVSFTAIVNNPGTYYLVVKSKKPNQFKFQEHSYSVRIDQL